MTNPLKPIDIIIGRNVKLARISRGLSQSDLAEALDLTFQQVQKYETATNRISASRLVQIARALDIDVKSLLPGSSLEPARNPLLSRQTMRLIQSFQSISDDALRASILSFISDLSRQLSRP